MNYEKKIKNAKTIAEMFEIVKKIVKLYLNFEQAGLLVGVTDLGYYNQGFVGAFYSINANTIIINKKPLTRIQQTKPSIYNFYLFHILLHEYIHSIGSYDEQLTRQLVIEISLRYFGSSHIISQLAVNIQKIFPNLTYPKTEYLPPTDLSIEYLTGIDRENTNYIN